MSLIGNAEKHNGKILDHNRHTELYIYSYIASYSDIRMAKFSWFANHSKIEGNTKKDFWKYPCKFYLLKIITYKA